MNVTLTFNVLFGLIAIEMLVGCGSMRNFEFSQIDDKIAVEQNRLRTLEYTLSEINRNKYRLTQFLNYTSSPAGRSVFHNARCNTPVVPIRPASVMHAGACDSKVQGEELYGGICSDDESSLLNHQLILKAITGALCTVGPGKLPKWARIPGLGKLAVSGAMVVARGVACASTFNRYREHIDSHSDCMGNSTLVCTETSSRWQNNEIKYLRLIQQEARESAEALRRCETFIAKYPGLDRISANNRFTALDIRAQEVASKIAAVNETILTAQRLKVSVEAAYQGYQEYSPLDPG